MWEILALLATSCDDDSLTTVQLTIDFKPNLLQEAERINTTKGPGVLLHDEPGVHRVWLPDQNSPDWLCLDLWGCCVKDFGLSSVPDVTQRHITDIDQFVVLATDGVWDVISNHEAVQIVSSISDGANSAKRLVEAAARASKHKRENMAMDDIFAIVLYFHNLLYHAIDLDDNKIINYWNCLFLFNNVCIVPCFGGLRDC